MLSVKEKAIFLGFMVTAAMSMINFSGKCDGINDKILRLHVLANSNSKEDQDLKLKVRDRVLLCCSKYMQNCEKDRESVKKTINEHKSEIIDEARNEILMNGYDYPVSVEIADDVYFNTREYNTVTIPAGNYEAVRVLIGEGQGKNWWCVMFPPMCLPAAQEKSELGEVLDDGQMDLVENGKNYEIKFKLWEGFMEFRNFILSLFEDVC